MDNIKNIKWISNPYEKLSLVDNVFYKNEILKELLNKKIISPDENKTIQSEIEKDIENFQKDLGFKNKADNFINSSFKNKKITKWLNFEKFFKNKSLISAWRKLSDFAKKHKLKITAVAWIVAYSTYMWISNVSDIKKLKSSAYSSVIEYQDNKPWNILSIPKTLEKEDYAKFIENISNLKVTRSLKMNINSGEFKDFDKFYWQYMAKLQKLRKNKYWINLTLEEGRTFLIMQYIATNTYIDYLKDKSEILRGINLDKNDYKIARYKNQLSSIERACNDLSTNREGKLERKIKSWNDYFTYYTDINGSFYVDWLEQKIFKY